MIQYNSAAPDAADRIIRMAEGQQSHRHGLEKYALEANVASEKPGQWLGFFVALSVILGGIYLIAIGKNALGMAAIGCDLAALVSVFIYGKRTQSKELKQKSEPFNSK